MRYGERAIPKAQTLEEIEGRLLVELESGLATGQDPQLLLSGKLIRQHSVPPIDRLLRSAICRWNGGERVLRGVCSVDGCGR